MRRLGLAGLLALAVFGAPAAAAAQSTWRLEQPPPPPGARFKVPLGVPGDLACLSASRCLLAVEGNSVVPRGLLFYDGAGWRQLSTVCGDLGDQSRVAWAGPDEFWTVTQPSRPRLGSGTSLCRFKGGRVVGSFSTADESPDPFRQMNSAACNGPSDCWFGGIGSQDPSGTRIGAFHLRWDGADLRTVYGPQGRGVTDVQPFGGRWYETTVAGVAREDRQTPVPLRDPEPAIQPIHTIDGTTFRNAPYMPIPRVGVPSQGTELLASDAAGGELWFVGGGAASGPGAPADTSVARPPIAVRIAGDFYQEVPIPEGTFDDDERFVDVAVVPGRAEAWVAVQRYSERGSSTAKADIARISADGSVERIRLPASGAGRGSASRIEITADGEGWLVTRAGWLFHLSDGRPLPRSEDPAFSRLIDFRPNESVAQSISDAPPPDDSLLFAPPPGELPAAAQPPEQVVAKPRAALLTKVSKPKVDKRLRLAISFTMRRDGRVALVARRKGRTVARTRLRLLRKGRHTLRVQLRRKRWPTALRFDLRELDGSGTTEDAGGSDETVST